jgi:predicted DNA-binding ribbon-helix-helix protein
MSALVSIIDAGRAQTNLSSAIRVFVLHHYRAQADGGKSGKSRTAARGRIRVGDGGAQ